MSFSPVQRALVGSIVLFLATACLRAAQAQQIDQAPPAAGSPQTPLSTESIYQTTLPSTMTLSVEDKDGTMWGGTAFIAIKEGIAVTAWHVVHNARRVSAKFSNGEQFEVSGLVDRDEARDVALIRIKEFGRPLIPLSATEPEVGSKAFVIGAPRGLDFSMSDGIVSQVRSVGGTREIQFSAASSPGNSGGPLLNAKAEVLGVVSWQRIDGQNLNFAIPSKYVLALDSTLPTQPWESLKPSASLPAVASEPTTPGTNPETTVTNEVFDKTIGDAEVSLYDLSTVRAIIYGSVVHEEYGYRDGLPVDYYVVTTNSEKHLQYLKTCVPTGVERTKLRDGVVESLSYSLASFTLLEKAIQSAQELGGWYPRAKDYLTQSVALLRLDANSLKPADWSILKGSKAFEDTAPKEVRSENNIEYNPNYFDLGASCYAQTSLTLVTVSQKSIANDMGLQSGDTLCSAGDVVFGDLMDFKVYLRRHAGEKEILKIMRDNKYKLLKEEIPQSFKAP